MYDLTDYEDRWGFNYGMFHRVNMHEILMDSATGSDHSGIPAILKCTHKCAEINHEQGVVTFENSAQAKYDVAIGADGIGSQVRKNLGFVPDRELSASTCLYCIIETGNFRRSGYQDLSVNNAIELWGRQGSFLHAEMEKRTHSTVSFQQKKAPMRGKAGILILPSKMFSDHSRTFTQSC